MQDLLIGLLKDHKAKMKIKGQQRSSFIESASLNGGQAIFYLLKCSSKDETFYKLGITVNHILTRYRLT